MRFVIKPVDNQTEKLLSQLTKDKINEIAVTKNKELISDSIYRDPYTTEDGNQSKVGDALAKTYHSKCAYCERLYKMDIEHYRPKKKVSEDVNHEGYYWLCYEWTNLLPACNTCNREGAKHTKFPILGARISEPSFFDNGEFNFDACSAYTTPLLDEVPGLLHPEIDDPEEYFKFESFEGAPGISLAPLNDEQLVRDRSLATINICKLNREPLRLIRLKIVQDIIDNFEAIIIRYEYLPDTILPRTKDIFHEVRRKGNDPKSQHTLFRKFILANEINFNDLVLKFCVHQKVKNLLEVAFREWHSEL